MWEFGILWDSGRYWSLVDCAVCNYGSFEYVGDWKIGQNLEVCGSLEMEDCGALKIVGF